MKIGFIGLGAMGGALARNIIRKGYEVKVFDLSQAAMDNTLTVGGTAADSLKDLASSVDVLFTSLPLSKHLIDLLIEKDKVLDDMKQGAALIDVSTVDPDAARIMSDAAEAKGIDFLSCPLGKGPALAEQGLQPIFAGGKEQVFNKYSPLLNNISASVTYMGDVEQAAAFKLISNFIGMTNFLVLAEGLAMGEKIGLEPHLFQKLLTETAGDSYQLELRGPMVLEEDYKAKFSVDNTLKDMKLNLEMAKSIKQMAPFSELASEFYQKAQDAGFGKEDCAAAYKIFSS